MSVHPEVCEAAVIALDVTAYIILGTGSSCKQVGHEPRNGFNTFCSATSNRLVQLVKSEGFPLTVRQSRVCSSSSLLG